MKKNTLIKVKKNRQKPRTKASSEILFIMLVAIGLIYLAALLTHSSHENPWSGDVALDASVANLAGIFGAYLSDISLSILGFSAYIIPIALSWFGWCVHKSAEQPKSPKTIILIRNFALIVLIAFSSAFLAQNFANMGSSGGYLGISMHDYFGVLFGGASFIVYLGIIMVSFSIVASASWINIFSFTGSTLGAFFANIQQRRAKAKLNKPEKLKITPKPTERPSVVAKVKAAQVKKIKKAASSNLFNTTTIAGLPSLDLLDEPVNNTRGFSEQVLENMSRQVE
ncbi:DNA translocase FtsK 4TM domain-containing protein, partial [Candidatus Thioglobus sp.]|nr:DNA translocase FtsK 4TM domain-containing protein [Candidatus Thioglobus sp.]